ncbi:hypothetical protein [Helicobacter pylori]|nr:hypothetical protein [Helicobacter pylori]ADU82104.1 hypothetical protein HPGAM_06605 [Helicobacter pylori Gambia94/24]EMG94595.1 hypothetical protein HMPREF1401_01240 [Helicobacter pylori GAM120Ai]EMH18036.1 hypothetical protein HMPREF1417_01494 [Helicobacter pylori GAM260Bi]EMH69191.1 hypothetical protein HMPREF1452_01675 [Helicobacter pylori HP260Bi]MDO7807396.1 hypothetical protein [Helicobacter pylori]
MNTNNYNNEKKNTITRRMKIAHNSLPETDRKAHMEPKWRELADIRSKMFAESKKQLKERGIQLKEKSKAQQQESFEREKELMEEEFQVQRELLEIYYGYPTQKNKPGIKYDDTIDIEPEDEKD